jgi:hypothetical protein
MTARTQGAEGPVLIDKGARPRPGEGSCRGLSPERGGCDHAVFIPWDTAALAGCRAANRAACLTPYRNRAHIVCKDSVG